MNLEEKLKEMQEKIGKENSGKIADDIATIISYDSARSKDIKNKDEEITKLKNDKEMLIQANGNLLQQISSESEEILKPKTEEKADKKPFDFRSVFDEKGNFKK